MVAGGYSLAQKIHNYLFYELYAYTPLCCDGNPPAIPVCCPSLMLLSTLGFAFPMCYVPNKTN